MLRLYAQLVLAGFGEVLHPSLCLVVAFVIHLQEAYLHARAGVHGDLEVHGHRWAHPRLLLTDRRNELHYGIQTRFGGAGERSHTPHEGSFAWLVLGTTTAHRAAGGGGCVGHRDADHYVGGLLVLLEIGIHL